MFFTKNLLESQKNDQTEFFQLFLSIFWSLETILGNIQKLYGAKNNYFEPFSTICKGH